jgi:NAD(P)-dependent dehydrogenase (short-subunit alcohol dehydrogenase family)
MNKTIFITGASTGIGKATVLLFAKNSWNVIATMRHPETVKEEFASFSNVHLLALDVTDSASITKAVQQAFTMFETIDVLFNNAGYGLVGPFEAMSEEQVRKQIETNLLGTMNVIRTVIPYFREKRQGMIITTTSMGGLLTFPLYSVYHATKWGLEGFLESLQYELRPFNIQIKNIEPGSIRTDFYKRSMEYAKSSHTKDYDAYFETVNKNMLAVNTKAPGPDVVAEKVFEAANDSSYRLRYPAGGNGPMLLLLRRITPFRIFRFLMSRVLEK